MTLVKKLILTGGGLVILFPAAVETIRIMGGHDDPIVVDNPKMGVNFSFLGHPMKVKRDSDGLAEELRRDIATLQSVKIVPRIGTSKGEDVNLSKPMILEDTKQGKLQISIDGNQFVVNLSGRQFGGCPFASVLLNRCSAKEDDRRLRTVQYTDKTGESKRLCLNDGEEMREGDNSCQPLAGDAPARLTFEFK